jgi:hypothetical protein
MSKLIVCGEEINDDFQFALYSKSHTKYRIELDWSIDRVSCHGEGLTLADDVSHNNFERVSRL